MVLTEVEIVRYNWNRISKLSGIEKKTRVQIAEMSFRTGAHNDWTHATGVHKKRLLFLMGRQMKKEACF